MRIQSTAALLALLCSASLRGIDANQQGLRRRLATNDCTIMAVEALSIAGEDPEMIIECEVHPDDADGIEGMVYPIDAPREQLDELRELIESGQVTPGYDILEIAGSEISSKGSDGMGKVVKTRMRTGKVKEKVKKGEGKGKGKKGNKGRRRLVNTSGDVNMLLVKVTDSNNLAVADSPSYMR